MKMSLTTRAWYAFSAVNSTSFQFWAKDTNDKWWDINEVGWGDGSGFPIILGLKTDIYVIATGIFEGDVIFELADVTGDYYYFDGDETVITDPIISQQQAITGWEAPMISFGFNGVEAGHNAEFEYCYNPNR